MKDSTLTSWREFKWKGPFSMCTSFLNDLNSLCSGFKRSSNRARVCPGSEATGHGANLDQLWERTWNVSRSDSEARWCGDESSRKHVTFQSTNAEIWGFCVLVCRDTRPSALLQAYCFWHRMNISAENLVLKNGTAVHFSCWPKLHVFSLSVSALEW